jgi:hypothetical protein
MYIVHQNLPKTKTVNFKLYFKNNTSYIKIYIWSTKKAMWEGADIPDAPKYLACYIPYLGHTSKKLKSGMVVLRGPNKMGSIHLYKTKIDVGILSHEILHAVFDLAYKLKIRVRPPSPITSYKRKGAEFCEYLCSELEYLTRRFWRAYFKRKKEIDKL